MRKRIEPILRIAQFITGMHYVFHIHHGYGWKLPFIPIAYFPTKTFGKRHGWKRMGPLSDPKLRHYHDCTLTGIY